MPAPPRRSRADPFRAAFDALMQKARAEGPLEARLAAASQAGALACQRAPQLAIEAYELLAALDPIDAAARIAVAALHAKGGAYDAARSHAARAFSDAADEALRAEAAFLLGEIGLARHTLAEAADAFDAAAILYDRLHRRQPDDTAVLHQLARLALRQTDIARLRGDADRARTRLATAQALLSGLAAHDPPLPGVREDQIALLDRQADLAVESGDLPDARQRMERLLALAEEAAAHTRAAPARRNLADALLKQAVLDLRSGALPEAWAHANRAMGLLAALAAAQAAPEPQIALARAARITGEIALAQGAWATAATLCARAAGLMGAGGLSRTNPAAGREESAAMAACGEAAMGDRQFTAAGEAFRAASALCAHWRATLGDEPSWRHAQAVALARCGDAAHAAGDFAGAIALYQESLDARGAPDQAPAAQASLWRRARAEAFARLGEAQLAVGDPRAAAAAFRQALALQAGPAEATPQEATLRTLAKTLERLGRAALSGQDAEAARSAWDEQLALCGQAARFDWSDPAWRRLEAQANAHLAALRGADAALRRESALALLDRLIAEGLATGADLRLRDALQR